MFLPNLLPNIVMAGDTVLIQTKVIPLSGRRKAICVAATALKTGSKAHLVY